MFNVLSSTQVYLFAMFYPLPLSTILFFNSLIYMYKYIFVYGHLNIGTLRHIQR
jgi:hypothetical protein